MFETKALYQNDSRWKDVKLGFHQKETIGTWGCLLTSMTMVANGFGFNETPKSLNAKMKAAGGFQGALVIPAALPNVCPGLIFKGYQPCENNPAPLGQIDAALAAGMPVIVQVDWSPKAGVQTHWVLLYGKENGRYLMRDPYRYGGDSPDKKLYLTDRYDHQGKAPSKAITGIVWFEGHLGEDPGDDIENPEPIEVPSDTFTVYSTADGLAMRNAPSLAGGLLKRLSLHVECLSLEPGPDGKEKVGVDNEWLHIQDPEEDQGYVAAWYLTLDKDAEEETEDRRIPVPNNTFTVYSTADGLAMRSEPSIAGGLMKRLPLYAELISLDPAGKEKVTQTGEWLRVQDSEKDQGYVAAWYLTFSKEEEEDKSAATKTGDKSLIVRPTTSGLAFRTAPQVVAHTLLKRLPAGATLIVVEPILEAKKKIGVKGQWLNVKDAFGQKGYVAAWYVTLEKEPALGVREDDKSADPTPDDELVLRTTVDALALRRYPMIAARSLIKRLPKAAELRVVEEDVEDKIGVSGKWIRVRDIEDDVGYVAAWYVVKR